MKPSGPACSARTPTRKSCRIWTSGACCSAAPKFEHSYPFCWRCDTPLIYYARESWYIKMTDVKEQLIANNNTVKWYPESIGKGRFGDWLENVQDWGRQPQPLLGYPAEHLGV